MEDNSFIGLSDMCVPEAEDIAKSHNGYSLFDDTSGEMLDPLLVAKGCQEELQRFKQMGVYSYCDRRSIPHESKLVNVRWVHVNKGSCDNPVVKCRLVCQEFNDGYNCDELFAGTPLSTL